VISQVSKRHSHNGMQLGACLRQAGMSGASAVGGVRTRGREIMDKVRSGVIKDTRELVLV